MIMMFSNSMCAQQVAFFAALVLVSSGRIPDNVAGGNDDSPASILVHANKRVGTVSPYMVGAGIEDVNHELYGGIASQMIFGENFAEPAGDNGVSGSNENTEKHGGITWNARTNIQSKSTYEVVSDSLAGNQSQQVTNGDTIEMASIINYGLDTQGFLFQGGHEYEGYVYAKTNSKTDVVVMASLINDVETLASVTFTVTASSGWRRHNFSMTTLYNTTCNNIATPRTKCIKNPENVCIQCTGGFMLSVVSPNSSVVFDFVWLQPGEWGRFQGLESRRDISASLFSINNVDGLGMNVLRLGGSMCNANDYRWKQFRGPRYLRAPYKGTWYNYASGSWRIFEFLDLCDAASIYCVVTINNNEAPLDMGDFVEYVYGNDTTRWGKQRISDGQHPQPYPPFMVEIGNEQALTDSFVDQVTKITMAMEARATTLQLPFKLKFAVGHNYKMGDLNNPLTDKMLTNTANSTMVWDCHVGGDHVSDALLSWDLLRAMQAKFKALNSSMKLGVFEENGGHHDLSRALGHARQNNRFSRLGQDFMIDTSANCLQAQSRNDNSWDQGILFYLPNMTYPSPLGFSMQMIALTQQPTLLEYVDSTDWNTSLDLIVVQSEDGTKTVVRVVNIVNTTVSATITLSGLSCAHAQLEKTAPSLEKTEPSPVVIEAVELFDDNSDLAAVNPPAFPHRVAPRSAPAPNFNATDESIRYVFRAYSFTTLTVKCTRE